MIIFLVIIVLLLLCLKVTVEIYVVTDNFKVEKTVKIKLFGFFEIKLPKLKKRQKTEVKENKKMTLADIKEKSDKIIKLAKTVLKAAEKIIVIEKMDTKIVLALSDPMANGLAFAAVNTLVQNVFMILSQRFKTKKLLPDIKTDFESESGVKTETMIILSVRLIRLIPNYEFRIPN